MNKIVYLLWLGQMSVQIQFGTDFFPVGEAPFLDARYMANKVRARLCHEVT